jgi:hypothetical protein
MAMEIGARGARACQPHGLPSSRSLRKQIAERSERFVVYSAVSQALRDSSVQCHRNWLIPFESYCRGCEDCDSSRRWPDVATPQKTRNGAGEVRSGILRNSMLRRAVNSSLLTHCRGTPRREHHATISAVTRDERTGTGGERRPRRSCGERSRGLHRRDTATRQCDRQCVSSTDPDHGGLGRAARHAVVAFSTRAAGPPAPVRRFPLAA